MTSRPFRLTAPVPSESDVIAGCKDVLELHRYLVLRNHAGLFQSMDCRRKIKGAPKGTPDFSCMHKVHRNFLLEVKRPGGQLSYDQRTQIAFIEERYGLPIVVVESVESLCNFLARHEHSP